MAREAELHDGRILEFPDGTPDHVIQQTVKRVLGTKEQGTSISMFPSFDAPQREIPTTPGGFAADLAGGALEALPTIVGGGAGLLAGGIGALGAAGAELIKGRGLGSAGQAAREVFGETFERGRTALGTRPETYSGQRFDETVGNLFQGAISGSGAAYENTKRLIDRWAVEYQRGHVSEEEYKNRLETMLAKSGEARPLVEGLVEGALLVLGARGMGKGIKSVSEGYAEAARGAQTSRKAARDAETLAEQKKAQELTQLQKDLIEKIDYEPPLDFRHDRLQAGVDVPGKPPRGTIPKQREYWPAKERIEPDYGIEVPDKPVDPYASADLAARGIERPRQGAEMLREDIPQQRELSLEEPSLDRPVPERTLPEQLELPLQRESALAREARETDLAFRQREGQVNPVSREEAFRRAEEERRLASQDDAIRRQLFEEEASGRDPRMPSQSGRVPRGERGQINPEVFREGFQKSKDIVTKAGTKIGLTANYETRDGKEYLVVEAKNADGKVVGWADFTPKDRNWRDNPEGVPLFSEDSKVSKWMRRQGIGTEIYKFANELGNDIVPSEMGSRSLDSDLLWNSMINKDVIKGVPKKQQGMFKPGEFGDSLSKLLNRSARHNVERTEISRRIAEIGPSNELDLENFVKADLKPFDQFVKEDLGGKVEDFPQMWDKAWYNIPYKLDTAWKKFVATFLDPAATFRATGNKVVKYIHDAILDVDARWNNFADLIKEEYRISYEGAARGPKKYVNPDSVKYRFDEATQKQRDEAAVIANELNDTRMKPDRAALLNKGYSQQAVDLALKMYEKYRDLHTRVNELLRSMDPPKPEINLIEGYMAKWFGEGPFGVRIVDPSAKPGDPSVLFHRAKSRSGARQLGEEALQMLKDKGAVPADWNPARVIQVDFIREEGRGRTFTNAPGLISNILESLDKSDPRKAIVHQVLQEMRDKYRAGGHRMRRNDVLGGELTGSNLYRAFDKYVDQMVHYAKNLELEKKRQEIFENTNMVKADTDLGKWVSSFIEASQGMGHEGKFLQAAEKTIDDWLHLHSKGGQRGINKFVGRVMLNSVLMVHNPAFYAASWGQSSWAGNPVLTSFMKANPDKNWGSPGKAMAQAFYDLHTPSIDQKNFAEWMGYRGEIDPTFTQAIGSLQDIAHFQSKYGERAARVYDWVIDYPGMARVAKKGESVGRAHAAFSAYNLLYDAGMRGKPLWNEAARLTRDIMGDYTRIGKPRWVRDTGVIGDSASTLATFASWYTGSAGIMLQQAFKGGPSPALKFFVAGTLFAGVIGAPYFAELEWIWDKLKSFDWFQKSWQATFGTEINEKSPSLSELLIENAPDAAVFGPIDAASKVIDPKGVRMMSGFTAPTFHMPGEGFKGNSTVENMFPAPTFMYKGIMAIKELVASELGLAHLTSQEKRKYLKEFPIINSPVVRSFWDNYDFNTKEFGPGMLRGGKHGDAIVEREDWWDVGASMLGRGTLKEARDKIARGERFEKRQPLADVQGRQIDLIVDQIEGETDETRLQLLYDKAAALGISGRDLRDRIYNRRRSQNTPEEQRKVGKGRTRLQQDLLDQINRREEARGN